MHPKRKMIVAIVVVKTRYAGTGPRELGIDRMGGSAVMQFWEIYDESVRSIGKGA
jgi:hypothetical protein